LAQKDSLQPLAQAMFAAATGAFSTLAGIAATAGAPAMDSADGSIKVEPDVVATLTRVPATGVAFVTRFVKADIGSVVAMMLGTPGDDSEMDAMQLSIVAETVAQIATAMGEALAGETGESGDGVHSEVINDAAGFPVPPFTSFTAPISVGDALQTSVTIDFDGLSLTKMDIKPQAAAAAAPAPAAVSSAASDAAAAMAAAMAGPPPPTVSPSRQRPAPEGQAAQFAPMQPTGIRPAAPGQSNLDLVHDVPLEISAVLGQTELSLREVVAMVPGSVFELDKLSTEPIDLYVNNILIARGEVVVVDDKFAVKISELNPVVDRI
jgi:flagellar motor switch protein FliN/FliY